MITKKLPYLHELKDFKALIEITAGEQKIKDPSLIEKDYWLMQTLHGLQTIGFCFHLKGGTSLSKGFGCIHRFSEDIDIKIEPEEAKTGFKVHTRKNQDDEKHCESRKLYFDWLTKFLNGKIHGIISVKRDPLFDDESGKYRGGGIRLLYDSNFKLPPDVKDGILLEVGFDRTAPNQPCDISSWAYEQAAKSGTVKFLDNRALKVPCYEPKYTFVEKLQAIVRKFRLYKNGKEGANLPANFIRHYYDLYQLIDRADVQSFIGTAEYEQFKKERFKSDDTKVSNSDAFVLSESADKDLFQREYARSESLYFRGRPTLEEILERLGRDLNKL